MTETFSPSPRAGAGRVEALLLARARAYVLVPLAGLPALVAVWMLLSPGLVMARQGVVDLLFNLAGAWQIRNDRIPHVDFHEPVGQLNFLLTALGFWLVGPVPFAFLVGETIVLAALFVVSVLVVTRRLPLAAAAAFVLLSCLPAVMPVNVGEALDTYSFAMSYNRYGWSALGILSLILFVPPRHEQDRSYVDMACAAVLLLGVFYLKITYFLVGLGALALALWGSAHIRANRRAWAGVGLVVIANAVAPHNLAYWADLWGAVLAGTQKGPGRFLHGVFGNSTEFGLYGIGLLAAIWLWQRGQVPLRVPAAAAFLIVASVFLFSQNTQIRGLPLGTIIFFVLYEALVRCRAVAIVPQLIALLLVPALSIAAIFISLAGYQRAILRPDTLLIVEHTNVRGLALTDFGSDRASLSYVPTLLEAAALFADGRHPPGRIQLFDQVNPLPFILGFPPARGGDLFWEPSGPLRPADELLADADYVLVPKMPTARSLTEAAMARYHGYLAEHFPYREDTRSWTLLSRRQGSSIN